MTDNQTDLMEPQREWDRIWYPIDSPADMVPDDADALSDLAGEGVSLLQVADTPCLVLLAEAGMGKSSEARKLARDLAENDVLVDMISGSDVDLPATLEQLLTSNHQHHCAGEQRPWHIIIDGIDEIAGTKQPVEIVIGAFLDRLFSTSTPRGALHLVFTSRSSAWTTALDQVVIDRWANDAFQRMTLAPLDHSQIVRAIERSDLDAAAGAQLSSLLEDGNLAALAGRPLLLHQLVQIYREQAAVPTDLRTLLRAVVAQALSSVPGDTRDSAFAAAGRMAAASRFSDRWQIATSSAAPDFTMISVASIAGGFEPTPAGRITITPALLAQCLHTTLFREVGPGVFEWAHRLFCDYLAAHYLADHRLSSDEILSLLNVQEVGGPGGIAPSFVEVAGWAAALVPTFFDALLERQPDILLQTQAAALEPDQRARLTEALIERLGSGDLLDQYGRLLPLLSRLRHPGLEDQLRTSLTNTSLAPFARRAAIDIATATGTSGLAGVLVAVAADPAADPILRTTAVYAAIRLGGARVAAELAPILETDLADDVEDRLRGALLTACWPDHLGLNALLRVLTRPRAENFLGPYQMFLYRFAVPQLTSEQALDALAWIHRRIETDDEHGRLLPIMSRLFWAAAHRIEDVGVRNAMAMVINSADHQLGRLVEADGRQAAAWPDMPSARVELVLAVLRGNDNPFRASANMQIHLPGLVSADMLDALLAGLRRARSDDQADAAYAQIIVDIAYRLPIDTLGAVWDAASTSTTLKRLLTERYSVDIGSVTADSMRRLADLEKQQDEYQDIEERAASDWSRAMTGLLDRIEAGRPELWWQLNLQLFNRPTGGYDASYEFLSDLTQTPGWHALETADRARVLRAAPSYLVDAPLQDTDWLGSSTSHRPANAGVRAMRLLQQQAPEELASLDDRTWSAWAPALIGFLTNDFEAGGKEQVELVTTAFEHAPDAVLAAVRQIATGERSEGLSGRTFDLLSGIADPRLAELLHELRESPDLRGDNVAGDILKFLVRRGDARATSLVIARLSEAPGESVGGPAIDRALAAAAGELLIRKPQEIWNRLLELRDRDPDLARLIWRKLSEDVEFRQVPELGALSEYDLAQAWIDLSVLFPERSTPRTGTRVLGVADHVDRFRSILLSSLVTMGTNAALQQLHRIEVEIPETAEALRWPVAEARRAVRSRTVRIEEPAEILARISEMGSAAAESGLEQRHVDTPAPDDTDSVPLEEDILVPDPAPEGLLPERDRLVILAVATEWTSHHGGITTLNRELCGALAKLGHQVICLVPDATATEILQAEAVSVQLVTAPSSPGVEGNDRLFLCGEQDIGAKPDFVIGHDQVTGRYGRAIATRVGSKYAHFLHTIPRENEPLKGSRGNDEPDLLKGDIKTRHQIELSEASDLVVAVGPRIRNHFLSESASPPRVAMLLPGLNESLLTAKVDPDDLPVINCLMSGRMEDAGVKGGLLACDVIKQVGNGRSWPSGKLPRLIMRGFSGNANAEFAQFGNYEDYKQFVWLKSFATDPVTLRNDYLKSALIIMPSVAEGFGLTGLEAIAAGIPVIISRESGLAEFLDAAVQNGELPASLVSPCIASVAADHAANCADWAGKMDSALIDPASAFERAESLRQALRPRLSWNEAARKLTAEMCAAGSAET